MDVTSLSRVPPTGSDGRSPDASTAKAPAWSRPTATPTAWPTVVDQLNADQAGQRGRRRRRHRHRSRQPAVGGRGRGRVRPDRPVLRQRRGRRRQRPHHDRSRLGTGIQHQRPRPSLGGEVPVARLAGPRRGLLLLDCVGRRAAQPDRLRAVLVDQARRGCVRRVAEHHLRRPGRAGQLPLPARCQHQHAQRQDRSTRAAPAMSCALPASCSSPTMSPRLRSA